MPDSFWSELTRSDEQPAYRFGTCRALSPLRTLRRLRPLLPLAGITRLVCVTDLDIIGIPVYQAVRPNSRNMSVSQGKGLTRPQAKVSALMESLESFHAEQINAPSVTATARQMQPRLHYDVLKLPMTASTWPDRFASTAFDATTPPIGVCHYFTPDTRIDWVQGLLLTTGEPAWCPRQLCQLDYSMSDTLALFPFRATSNGLASGNTMIEAVIHGLCEVIERDSFLTQRENLDNAEQHVDPESIHSRYARAVLHKVARRGFGIEIVDMTGPMGVPCFEAAVTQPDHPVFKGYGCHPSRDTALLRALTEAVQSRLTHISGTRDDLYRSTYRPPVTLSGGLFAGATADFSSAACSRRFKPGRDYSQCADLSFSTWRDVFENLVSRIVAHTGTAPMAIDLRRHEFQIPVVFVIAPGLQGPATRR